MTQWVTISSHQEFWKILRALGHDSIEPVDILRIDSGLMLLRGLGLRPTWPNGHAIVERLISESRRLIGGARRVAHQIGATPDNINKIFRKCHLPTLDVACRWATRLVVLARDRGVEPPDVLLRVALDPVTSASAPSVGGSVGGSVGENADSARGVGESVGATRPAVGESVGAMRQTVGESVGAMRQTVGESVGETTDSAQNVGEIVGENADSAHRQPGHEEFEAGRLTAAPIVEHGSLVMTTIEWRYAGGRRMQQECAHHEARSLIDKYYDEWAGAEILINGKPFDDTRIFLTRSFRAMEARLERKLEAMIAGQPQAQGSPQAKTDLKSTLDEVLAPLRDELIGLRQRMETAPSPALRMIASVVLDMMEEDDDG